MARRRLNTKLFAIVLGTIVLGGAGVLVWAKYGKPAADPAALAARADASLAAGKVWDAIRDYQNAANAEPNNPTHKRKLGEAYIRLQPETVTDPAFPNNLVPPVGRVIAAHRVWQDAAQLDAGLPDTKRAMELLVESLWEGVEAGLPDTMTELPRWAERLLAIDPGNTKVAVWRHVATIKLWLSGQAVSDAAVKESEAALQALAAKDPANAEAPYALAMIQIRRGRTAAKDQFAGEATDRWRDAAQVMDKAMAGQEANATMQYNGYLVFANLSVLDKANEAKHQERLGKCIAAAMSAVRPDTPRMENIYVAAADWQARTNQTAEARKTRKTFYDQYPDNQRARLTWAWQLAGDKAERPAAIEILSKEVAPPKNLVGVGILLHQRVVADTLGDLVRVRLLDVESEADAAKRAAVIAAADADMDKLRKLGVGNDPRVMAIEGRVLYAKGKRIEAVQALEAAYAAMKLDNSRKDHESLLVLAQIHARTNQPGRAIEVCEDILKENSGQLAARLMLAQLLLKERRLTEAGPHVAALTKALPDNPEVKSVGNLLVILAAEKPEFVKQYYDKLPETTPAERRFKYEFARRAEMPDEQIRLLIDIVKGEPKDPVAALMLYRLYKQKEQPERAKAALEAGLKENPEDTGLKLAMAEAGGATPDQMLETLVAKINAEPDVYNRNVQLYNLYRQTGKGWDLQLAALKAANAAKPDGIEAHRALFAEYLARGKFDDAVPHRDFLVKADDDAFGGRLTRHQYHVAKGEFEAALAIGDELVAKYGDFASSWFARGQAQEALGQWGPAIESFNQVLSRQPTNYAALRAVVDTYYNDGQTEQAKVRLKRLRELFPEDTVVRELYLGHLANFGEPELAIPEREELLKKAIDDKKSKDPWPYLALAATYFKNAQKLSAANDKKKQSEENLDKAFQTLQAGQIRFPDDTRFYAQVAEMHQYRGKLDQGEEVLKKFCEMELTKQPPAVVRPDPWLALADFYNRSGQAEQTVTALEEALARSNDSLEVRLKLVSAMVQAKQYATASQRLDAVAANPDPRIARQRLEILVAQGSLADAEREIRAALEKRDAADLRNLMASVLIDTGRPEQSLPEIERALRLDRGNETARYLEALALSRVRPPRIPEAIERLDKLKNLNPRNVQARLLLADLQDRNGQKPFAVQQLTEALEKIPGSRELRLALIRLYRSERPPNFAKAAALVAQAEADPVLKTDPTWPREAALLYRDNRMPREAIVKMTQAQQLAPGNTDYRRELIELQLQFGDFFGAVFGTDKLLKEGIDAWWLRYQRAQGQARQVTREMVIQAKTDQTAAKTVQDLQRESLADYDRALAALDATRKNNPGPLVAAQTAEQTEAVIRMIGMTVGYDAALQRAEARLGDDPDKRWVLTAISLKKSKGDLAGATADVERMLADPANAATADSQPGQKGLRMAILRAATDVYQGQTPPNLQKAKDCYLEVLQLDKTNIMALNNLAYILAEEVTPPDPQGAKVYSDAAYRLTSAQDQNPLIIDTHGWVLVLCGGNDAQAGISLLRGVVEKSPNFVEARYHLAEGLLRQPVPDPVQAKKELQECQRLLIEEENLRMPPKEALRTKVDTALGKIREGGQ